jgi:hypothetical protein
MTAGSLSSNQFNVYWSNYMSEITDKNSKLVIGNFYLTTKDILNLDFSKYIYVDGIAFRLNAIKDYDATTPNDCVVELFKVNSRSYSEAPGNEGPPDGCYLLWSDEQTLDWDDGEPLLYGNCNDNPGDGEEPEPGTVFYLNWVFTNTTLFGIMRIYVNGNIHIWSTSVSDSGSFVINAGDSIQVDVAGQLSKPKRILVTNDVDGTIHDNTSTLVTNTYSFTVDANKNYSVVGAINN